MAIRKIKIGNAEAIDIYDARIEGIDTTLSTSSDNPVKNSTISTEFEKVSYIGDPYDTVPDVPSPEPDPPTSLFEYTANKVTSLSSSSTDLQYPSAKCVYDIIGDVETLLAAI